MMTKTYKQLYAKLINYKIEYFLKKKRLIISAMEKIIKFGVFFA